MPVIHSFVVKYVSRAVLFSLLTVFVLTSACNLPAQVPPAPTDTIAVGQWTSIPTSTVASSVALIPITGLDVVSLQCQFCVNQEAHALLLMSNEVFFDVSDPASGVTCLTAQETAGRRIVLCRGTQQASFILNVCMDASNCLQFPITLQTCPLIPNTGLQPTSTPWVPILLTPVNTFSPPSTQVPRTPVPSTPQSTDPPPPTEVTEPPPPEPTNTPKPNPTKKPTKTPKSK